MTDCPYPSHAAHSCQPGSLPLGTCHDCGRPIQRCPTCAGVNETWNRTYASHCRTCGEALDPLIALAGLDWVDGSRLLKEGERKRTPLPEEIRLGMGKGLRAKLMAAPRAGWLLGLGKPDEGKSRVWWRSLGGDKANFTELQGAFHGQLRMALAPLPDLLLLVCDASLVLYRLDPRPGMWIERIHQWTWPREQGHPQDPILVEPDPGQRSLVVQGVTLDDADQLRRFRLDLGSLGKEAAKAQLSWSKPESTLRHVENLAGPFRDGERILLLTRHHNVACRELDPTDLNRMDKVDLPSGMQPSLQPGSVVRDVRHRRLLALRADKGVDVWNLETGGHHTLSTAEDVAQFGRHSLHLSPDGSLLAQRGAACPALQPSGTGTWTLVHAVQSHFIPLPPLFMGRDAILVVGGALAPHVAAVPLAHENSKPDIVTDQQLMPGQAPVATLGCLAWLDLKPQQPDPPELVVCLPPFWKGRS